MQLKKAIVSVILLLVYSLGFAHNLIPHFHAIADENISQNEIKQHHHHGNHDHVHHKAENKEDAFENFLQLLVNLKHIGNNTEFAHYIQSNSEKGTASDSFKVTVSFLFSFVLPSITQAKEEPTCTSFLPDKYLSPALLKPHLRGPPKFSC